MYTYIYIPMYIHAYLSDPINDVCSLSGIQISGRYLTYHAVQTFKYCAGGQMVQGLILRTRLCGSGFITQHG